jgi:sucrose-6-phosphate hydrolase SacC (GH32 family)
LAWLLVAFPVSTAGPGTSAAQAAQLAGRDTSADAQAPLGRDVFEPVFIRSAENPLLSIRTSDPWDGPLVPGAVHPSVLLFPAGMDGYRYWMVYTPYTQGGDWQWERPTLVRSNDGIHWVKTGDYSNPLFGPGAPGEWDAHYLADPDLVYTPDQGWFLYYAGAIPQYIGVATSDDGKHWTKYAGNPILTQAVPDGPDTWTRTPSVLYDGSGFHMWYNIGTNDIGYATSPDGLHWTPYAGNPVLSPTPGSWDAASISHQDVITHAGQYWMVYVGGESDYMTSLSIGLATSPDGIHWTKDEGSPVLAPGTDRWERGTLYRPSPVVVDDELWLYYSGVDTPNVTQGATYEIGLAKAWTGAQVVLYLPLAIE